MNEKMLTISFLWKIFERISVQTISLIVQLILARMIGPKEFGSLSIIIVFYNIADLFVQKGFGSSLIRKRKLYQEDVDTSFLVSLIFAGVTYGIIFTLAPKISIFYGDNSIITPLRVLSINILISPLFCVYNAVLVRNMQFKIIFLRGLFSSVLSGLIGIILAYFGLGIWALVFQIVSNQFILTATMIILDKIKIGFNFSIQAFKEIFSFGKDVLITELLLIVVEGLRTLFVGKKYTSLDLAYYDRGQLYPATLMRAINDTMISILLPHLSKQQNNCKQLKLQVKKFLYMALIIVVPIFIGLAAIAEEIILILLTPEWNKTIVYMKIFCLYQAIFPYQIICKTVLYAIGNSKKVLKIEIVKSIISLTLMIICLYIGVVYVAASLVIVRIISNILYLNCIRLKFGDLEIIKSTWKPYFATFFMYIVLKILNYFNFNIYIMIILKIIVGIIIYIVVIMLIDKNFFYEMQSKIQVAISKK